MVNSKILLHKKSLLLIFILGSFFQMSFGQMRQMSLGTQNDQVYNLSFYNANEGYVATVGKLKYTQDSGKNFIEKPIAFSNIDFNGYAPSLPFSINGVKAFNKDTLIVYGSLSITPAILISTNQGNNFKVVFLSDNNNPNQLDRIIKDMSFPSNGNVGYAVDYERVLKTTNKGQTWSILYTQSQAGFNGIEVPDVNTVYAHTGLGYSAISGPTTTAKFVKTTNGGTSWTNINLPSGNLISSSFLNLSKGWISMDTTRIFYTSNGGNSWLQKTKSNQNPIECIAMKFINDSVGFGISGIYNIYKTTDSGKIWEAIPRTNNFQYAFYSHTSLNFLNNNHFWAGGKHSLIETNTNVGGPTLPRAMFSIDTIGVSVNNTVKLNNHSKTGYQYKWFVNGTQISTSYNTSYVHNIYKNLDTIKLIVTSAIGTDTLEKYQNFVVPILPHITSFSPIAGSLGTQITIIGTNLNMVNGVKFGGVSVQSFSIVSNTQINAIVANGSSGYVLLQNNILSDSLNGFTYYPPPTSQAPIINNFSPQKGLPGSTVTINGSGFGNAINNNIVFFGGTKATISSANSTQIICNVPTGASLENIKITNLTNKQSGESFLPFTILFADSTNFTANSFPVDNGTYIDNGTNVNNEFQIAVQNWLYVNNTHAADFDGDSKQDLLVVYGSWNGNQTLELYRNIANGNNFNFLSGVSIPQPINTTLSSLISCADINGDGKLDIIVKSSNGLNIFINNSTIGNFQFSNDSVNTIFGYDANDEIKIVDLDGDGRNDIVLKSQNTCKAFRNTSNNNIISFSAEINLNIPQFSKIVFADLNKDGKSDLIVTYRNDINNTTINPQIYPNISNVGSIIFNTPISLATTNDFSTTYILKAIDFDSDDKVDILAFSRGKFVFYKNNTSTNNITFNSPQESANLEQGDLSFIIDNLSGDAKPDIGYNQFANIHSLVLKKNNTVSTSLNLDEPVVESNCASTYSNVADMNLDGKNDLILAYNNKVTIRRNRVGEPDTIRYCQGADIQIYSDLNGTTYQWQHNSGAGFVNLTNNSSYSGCNSNILNINNIQSLLNNTKFRCLINNNLYSKTSILKVTSVNFPNSLIITTPNSTICKSSTTTFSSSYIGNDVFYQWKVNNNNVGTNSNSLTLNNLNNGDSVTLVISKSVVGCANYYVLVSNKIYIIVVGITPVLNITAPFVNNVCPNTTYLINGTLTANNVSNVNYQWNINGNVVGGNSPQYSLNTSTYGPNNSISLKVIYTDSCGTSTILNSNVVNFSVSPTSLYNQSISILNIPYNSTTNIGIINPTCQGNTLTFEASPNFIEGPPTYQWKINSFNVGTNSKSFSSNTLKNGDTIQVFMTNNATCASPSTYVVSSQKVIANITYPQLIISGPSQLCINGSTQTYTVGSQFNDYSNYQWKKNGLPIGTNDFFVSASNLNNSDKIQLFARNNRCTTPTEVASNIITISVANPLTPSVSIFSSLGNTICTGQSVTFTSQTNFVNTNLFYKWFINGTVISSGSGVSNSSFTTSALTNGSIVKVEVTPTYPADCIYTSVIPSSQITMTVVTSTATPTVSIASTPTTACTGDTVKFIANYTLGGTNPYFVWKKNGVNFGFNSNTATLNNFSNGDIITVSLLSNASCASPQLVVSNAIQLQTNSPLPTLTASGTTTVITGSSSNITTTNTNGGTTPTYQWQDSILTANWTNIAGATNSSINYTPTATGVKLRCRMTSNANCASPNVVNSNSLTFTVTTATAINLLAATSYGIKYFPNPVENILTIDSLKLLDKWQTVEIKEISGKQISVQTIANKTTVQLNVASLAKGMYVAILRKKDGLKTYLKFIKN